MTVAAMIQSAATAIPAVWGPIYTYGISIVEDRMSVQPDANCTLSHVRMGAAAGNDGTQIMQVRVDAADGNGNCFFSGSPNFGEDTTNSDSVTSSNVIALRSTRTGTNSDQFRIGLNVDFGGSDVKCFHGSASGGAVCDVDNATRYQPLMGSAGADGGTTPTGQEWKVRSYDTWDSLQCYINSNARTSTSTIDNRINGSTGSANLTIGSGVTGRITDHTVGDSLSSGDTICASVTLGTGSAEDLVVGQICAILSGPQGQDLWIASGITGLTRNAGASADFFPVGGHLGSVTYYGSHSAAGMNLAYATTISRPRIRLNSNFYTGSADLKLAVNGTNQLTVTVGAGVSGWVENTADSYAVGANDMLSWEISGGTSSSANIGAVGFSTSNVATYDVTDAESASASSAQSASMTAAKSASDSAPISATQAATFVTGKSAAEAASAADAATVEKLTPAAFSESVAGADAVDALIVGTSVLAESVSASDSFSSSATQAAAVSESAGAASSSVSGSQLSKAAYSQALSAFSVFRPSTYLGGLAPVVYDAFAQEIAADVEVLQGGSIELDVEEIVGEASVSGISVAGAPVQDITYTVSELGKLSASVEVVNLQIE